MMVALIVAGVVAYLAIGVLLVRVCLRYSSWARDTIWDEVTGACVVAIWPAFITLLLIAGLGLLLGRAAGVNR